MSAYGNQIEREYSAQSIPSENISDMGSEFNMESVIYMSSCAATVLIGALVLVGILMMTLLTSLTVMLQSCQNREAGVVESFRFHHHHHHGHDHHHDHDHGHHHYDYCKMAALNAEISNFEEDALPEICKDVGVDYIKEGHYMRELNNSVSLVENYFNGVTPSDDGHDVVLMDIDDILNTSYLESNPLLYGYNRYSCDDCVREAKHMKHVFLVELYKKIKSGGWSLILLSRKPEKQRDATIENLKSLGCGGWSKLIMRSSEGMKMDTRDYFLKQKTKIESEGYHIRGVISSHMDMLVGPFIKAQNFKLPNPLPVGTTQRTV